MRFETKEAFDMAAAQWVLEKGFSQPEPVWILPTGSTPEGMYHYLCKAYREGRADFSAVTFFNLDEYQGLPKEDAQSYYSYMQTHLYRHIAVPQQHIRIPDGNADPAEACNAYDAALDAAGTPTIAVLGVGCNGHIGFNEPGSNPSCRTHVQVLNDSTRGANQRFFVGRETPRSAITMGIADILKAKHILLLVNTLAKAALVEKALSEVPTRDCPVSFLQNHPDLTVFSCIC